MLFMLMLLQLCLLVPAVIFEDSPYVIVPVLLSFWFFRQTFKDVLTGWVYAIFGGALLALPFYERFVNSLSGWAQFAGWLFIFSIPVYYAKKHLDTTNAPDDAFFFDIMMHFVIIQFTYYFVALNNLSSDGYYSMIHNFKGYWVALPLVSALLLIIQYRDTLSRATLISRHAEHRQNEQQINDRIEKDIPKLLSDWDDMSKNALTPIQNDDIPVKWLTLDEQFAYFNGLHQSLGRKYDEVFYNPYKDDGIDDLFWEFNRYGYRGFEAHSTLTRDDFDVWRYSYKHALEPLSQYVNRVFTKKEILSTFENIEKGIRGEEELEKELKQLPDNWRYLTNVRVVVDGLSSESDALIFSPYGIFTIEAKNFGETGSYSIRVSKDGKWTKKVGSKTYGMKDVVAQSNRHVLAKEKLLNRTLIAKSGATDDDYIEIQGVITLTNDVVDIENESPFPIIRLSQLHTHIRQFDKQLTQIEIADIYTLFKDNMLPPQKFPVKDYLKEWEMYRDRYQPVVSVGHQMYRMDKDVQDLEENRKSLKHPVTPTESANEA